jgi:CubicO group peptidase (beta-lactamase class C family)
MADITVSQLLTHTSGLPAWLPLYCLAEGRAEDVPKRLGEIVLGYSPGTRVVYSCLGFITLGLMLSRVSGQRLDALFTDQVLLPMNLAGELGYCPDPSIHALSGGAVEPRVETGAVLALGLDPTWIPPTGHGLPDDGNARFLGGVSGNAGLFGTANGVFRIAQEFLAPDPAILAPGEAEAATRSHTPGLEQARGYGWQLATSPGCSAGSALSDRAFGHNGFTGVSVWVDPLQRAVFVLLTNRNHPSQRQMDLHPFRRRFHARASQAL